MTTLILHKLKRWLNNFRGICLECGNAIKIDDEDAHGRRSYCSRECASAARKLYRVEQNSRAYEKRRKQP